jgi:SAM-dependent methyltransferase
MNWLDRVLQQWRIRHAVRWIPDNARVLDVGCFDDTLFRQLQPRLGAGVGIDPRLEEAVEGLRFRLVPGAFPDASPPGACFDVITMLAVLEHVSAEEMDEWARSCIALLEPGGLVVATVPAPVVDTILDKLMRLRLLHGMDTDQHHGADPALIAAAFELAGFTVVAKKRFQLGLNNVFVFSSPTSSPAH